VLALHWPTSAWVLVDSDSRRVGFLDSAVLDLALGDRVEVVHARAEALGRDPARRARFDLVTARSFGAPALVAECAAPFLRLGGELVVSDPPEGGGQRWPDDPLALLGLVVDRHTPDAPHFTVLRQAQACPDRFPRVPAAMSKRPLF
jgi:16S rRNA (guanine527-N7)-methyltransferase